MTTVPDAVVVRAVVDENAPAVPDLVGGQPRSVRRGVGFEKIVDQVCQFRVEHRDRDGGPAEHRIAGDRNGVDGH